MTRFLCVMLTVLLTTILSGCGLSVPTPEIESGEFDFSVTYELNGEIKTVSGVYVCEYDGTSWALDGGYHRAWNGYIKDDKLEEPFQIGTTDDGGKILLNFRFYPHYFMGDHETGGLEPPAPWIAVQYPADEFGGVNIISGVNELKENYGAKIISYEYDEPIENTFG